MLEPWDDHNQRLAAQVHPADWTNPVPRGRYHLLVVGGGPAGLGAAAGAAGLGARVALIERHLLGGDCLNVGCVPSKALLASAKAAAHARHAAKLGVHTSTVSVDFPAVMARMRQLRADLARHDSAARFRDLGIDVFLGEGHFSGRDAFTICGQTLRFARACIATGARAALPTVPGLGDTPVLTNETLFNLTALPQRLTIIGAGPIGCEMAQAFARFGSAVTLLDAAPRILPREAQEASALVAQALEGDGVHIEYSVRNPRIEADAVLMAAGRVPNVEGLNLEAAGVNYTKKGVTVDDRLRTSNPHIFAAGDVASAYAFTHAADALARIVIRNALFLGRAKVSALTIPWCTYTDPECAHVGETAEALKQRGADFASHTLNMDALDRAILDGETEGFVTVHADPKGKILGADAVGARAGDLIGEISLAMTHGITLGQAASAIHPYPTYAEAFRKLGDVYNRTRLTPTTRSLLGLLLRRLG